MRLIVVLLIVLTLPSTSFAQEAPSPDPPTTLKPTPIVTLPPGPDKITSMKKGQLVPYPGQLFSTDTAIRWGFWLQQYKYRLEADAAYYQGVCSAKITYKDTALTVETERAARVEKDMGERLLRSEKARLDAEEAARNPPWYRSTWLGVGVGVVASVAVMGVTAALVDAASGN